MMAQTAQLIETEIEVSINDQATSTTSLTPIKLSEEQSDIANEVRQGRGNILVVARAGTGKTFLLVACASLMRGTIAVCAYNSKIAKEMKEKLGLAGLLRSWAAKTNNKSGADAGTFHSFGWGVVRERLDANLPINMGGVRLEGINDRIGKNDKAGFYKFKIIAERLQIPPALTACVRKAMERAQERGFGVDGMPSLLDGNAWLALADHFALETELPEDGTVLADLLGIKEDWRTGLLKMCLQYARKAIIVSIKMATEIFTEKKLVGRGANRKQVDGKKFRGVISFGEMLYLPLVMNLPMPQYNWVLVDEYQDTNAAREEMASRMLAEGGRFLLVGDPKQAIYGFTGANTDAMTQAAQRFNCKTMKLTVTFRCAKSIVKRVQRLVPDYKAANDNPDGSEYEINEDEFSKVDFVVSRNGPKETGDAIICRNTAPLVEIAYKLLKRGIACHVEGREIGNDLLSLVNRWSHLRYLPALTDKLIDYRDREIAILNEKNQEGQAADLEDRVEAVLALISGMPKDSTIVDLTERVNSLFDDSDGSQVNRVILLTIHKSKGLEFTRVFLYGVNIFIPSKWATKDWQLEQEENLVYVGETRAIHTLVNVNAEPRKKAA